MPGLGATDQPARKRQDDPGGQNADADWRPGNEAADYQPSAEYTLPPGLHGRANSGTKMNGPEIPWMSEGTPASSSMAVPSGRRSQTGQLSVRKTAMPKLTGTPTNNAINDVLSVP